MDESWAAWRLVLGGLADYGTVFHQMTPEEITLANLALDRAQRESKK